MNLSSRVAAAALLALCSLPARGGPDHDTGYSSTKKQGWR